MENIPQVPKNPAKAAYTHNARKAFSATLSVLKWTGAIFRPRSLTPSARSFYLCPFYWNLRLSGVRLESPALENIPQIPRNRAKVAENHNMRKAVSATFLVFKSSRAIFRPGSSTPSMRSFYLCPFHWKLRPSEITLEWPGLENIRQVLPNGAKVVQNHDARKAVSVTLLVLKWNGAIFGLDAQHRACAPFTCVLFRKN